MKFFFKLLKKVGPDINPTDSINKISPMFSITFNKLLDISIFSPLYFCETVILIWSENKAP